MNEEVKAKIEKIVTDVQKLKSHNISKNAQVEIDWIIHDLKELVQENQN